MGGLEPKSHHASPACALVIPQMLKPVGNGLSEMRIPHGPGYRIYYKQTERTIIVILWGGDKSTQNKDIERAKEMAAEL